MAKNEKSAKSEVKRTRMTPAERIAKLEADAEALRQKEQAKADAARGTNIEKRAKIRDKMVELNTKHNDLTDAIGDKAYANVTIDAGQPVPGAESSEEPAQPEQG